MNISATAQVQFNLIKKNQNSTVIDELSELKTSLEFLDIKLNNLLFCINVNPGWHKHGSPSATQCNVIRFAIVLHNRTSYRIYSPGRQ